jgi:hypothetical protein
VIGALLEEGDVKLPEVFSIENRYCPDDSRLEVSDAIDPLTMLLTSLLT